MLLKSLARPPVAVLLLLLLAGLQLAYNLSLPLHGDEAYYWVLSRHPDLSYYDHPPMIAWLLAVSTHFGSSVGSVRVIAVVCTALSAWLIYRLARELHSERAASLALIIFLVLPVTQMGALLTTPDAPLILFWTLAMVASYRAVFDGGTEWFLAAGAAIGAALLSKYTAILMPAALLVFLLLRRRGILMQPRAWLAMGVALAVFAPVLIWNGQNDWISFAFQYGHGSSSDGRLHWQPWFEFIAGILLAFSPLLLVLALLAAFDRQTWRHDRRVFVAAFLLLPLAFFLYKGLFKKMELNWVAVAFPAAAILAAIYVVERRWWKTGYAGLVLALVLSFVIKFPDALGLPAKWQIQHRLLGYREASLELLRLRQPGEALYADHLTTASLLSFYAPGHPDVRIPTPSRFSQYDLWGLGKNPRPASGLYLSTDPREADLGQVFGRVERLATRPVEGIPKTFYLYRCQAQ